MDGDLRCSFLVGRESPLGAVRDALDHAADARRGSALFVCGEAGSGSPGWLGRRRPKPASVGSAS